MHATSHEESKGEAICVATSWLVPHILAQGENSMAQYCRITILLASKVWIFCSMPPMIVLVKLHYFGVGWSKWCLLLSESFGETSTWLSRTETILWGGKQCSNLMKTSLNNYKRFLNMSDCVRQKELSTNRLVYVVRLRKRYSPDIS